jgi:hypothetical protein
MEYQHTPPSTATFKLIERHLERKIKKALTDNDIELEDIEDPFAFVVKRKTIRLVIKNIEDSQSWFREEHKRYLIPDQEIFSHRKWIFENKRIRENLARKRNSKLIQLMNYLCNHRLGIRESILLAGDIGAVPFSSKTKKGDYVEYALVLVIPDFEDIENKLDMSLSLIRKYLKGMSESKFIIPIRKCGSNEQKVYSLGYYLPYEGEGGTTRYSKIWFLKNNKEMRQALMNFYRPE